MAIDLGWPRREVYNATGPYHWYPPWGAAVFVGAIALAGFGYYRLRQRHRTGVLAEHAVVVPAEA